MLSTFLKLITFNFKLFYYFIPIFLTCIDIVGYEQRRVFVSPSGQKTLCLFWFCFLFFDAMFTVHDKTLQSDLKETGNMLLVLHLVAS